MTHKENITAILECYFTGFKKEIIDSACNRILEQEACDDCISRQAVLDKLNRLIEVERLQGTDEMGYGRERVSAYESMIFEINSKYLYPSINPQEPCDDCISRQAVLDINENHHGQMPNHVNHEIWNEIKALPFVTPKEKTGRWISFGIQGEIDGQIIRAFTCSKCGAISIFRVSNGNIVNGDFCPNCGAKMQEVENDT